MDRITWEAMMSTGQDDYETPPELFAELDREFHFTLDPCCTHQTAKCKKHYTPKEDGLAQDWSGETVFCNPPYSRGGVLRAKTPGYESATKRARNRVQRLWHLFRPGQIRHGSMSTSGEKLRSDFCGADYRFCETASRWGRRFSHRWWLFGGDRKLALEYFVVLSKYGAGLALLPIERPIKCGNMDALKDFLNDQTKFLLLDSLYSRGYCLLIHTTDIDAKEDDTGKEFLCKVDAFYFGKLHEDGNVTLVPWRDVCQSGLREEINQDLQETQIWDGSEFFCMEIRIRKQKSSRSCAGEEVCLRKGNSQSNLGPTCETQNAQNKVRGRAGKD